MVLNLSLWGLRISEHVYLDCGQVHKEYVRLVRTKGNKPRNVLIDPEFSKILHDHLNWKRSNGESVEPDAPFFYSRKKTGRYSRQGLAKAYKRAILRAKIGKNLSSHSGRHTLASHNEPGFSQGMLGHGQRKTTEIYTHVLEAQGQAKKYGKKLYAVIKEHGKKRRG